MFFIFKYFHTNLMTLPYGTINTILYSASVVTMFYRTTLPEMTLCLCAFVAIIPCAKESAQKK